MKDEFVAAVKGLLRSRVFVLVSLASMAAALGLNIAVLSLGDRLLFRPLPYRDPASLVQVHLGLSRDPQFRGALMPAAVTTVLSQEVDAFQGMAWAHGWVTSEVPPDGGNALELTPLTPDALTLLGVQPLIGRPLSDADVGTEGVLTMLLAHRVWRERFGGDEQIVDRSWTGRGKTYRVAGILPPGFILPSSKFLDRFDGVYVAPVRPGPPGLMAIAPFARLKPGVSVAEAQAEVDVVMRRHEWTYGPLARDLASGSQHATVLPLQAGLTILVAPYFWLVSLVVWVVLGLSSLNLSILLLTRNQARRREFALRAMLGATPARLARSVVIETAVLVGSAALLAAVVCVWSDAALVGLLPPSLRDFAVSPLDSRILLSTLVGVGMVAVIASIVPTLAAIRVDAGSLTGAAARRPGEARRWDGDVLLGLQAACALVVMVGAVVAVPPVARFLMAPIGFEPTGLFLVTIEPSAASQQELRPLNERASSAAGAIATLARVHSAAASVRTPLDPPAAASAFWAARGVSGAEWEVGDGFFRTMGTDIVAGRGISAADETGGASVVVLNRSGLRAALPGIGARDVVGRTIEMPGGARVVVGVVDDIRREPGGAAVPSIFVPIRRELGASKSIQVVVRMEAGALLDRGLVRQQLTAALPVGGISVQSVSSQIGAVVERPRLLATLFSSLAAVCLMMIAIGVYAVAAVRLDARRVEIAIRRALGATNGRVVRRVCRLMWPALGIGLALGTALALIGVRLLASTVTELDVVAVSTYVWACAGTVSAAVAGMMLPLWRSLRADPGRILQEARS